MGELSQAVEILRECGEPDAAVMALLHEKVDIYVAKAGEDALNHVHFGAMAKLAVDMIRERVEKLHVKKSIPEVVESMSKDSGYTPSDLKYLKDTTVDEFYDFIKTSKNQNFLGSLKTFHERVSGNEDPAKTVRERLEQALED